LQTLSYHLSVTSQTVTDGLSLFAVDPAVSPEGTLTYTPADNANGTATISIKVQDTGGGDTDTSAEQSFTIAVTALNDKPVITGSAAAETPEDTPYVYAFRLADVEDGPDHLTIEYETNNTALLEKSSMTLGGSGADRTLTVSPEENRSGTVTITFTITDSQGGKTVKTVELNVTAVNDAPTISAIVNRTTDEDTSTGAIGFTIGDVDTDLSACTISAVSDHEDLVPNDSIHITPGGSGANRTVTLLPAQDKYGTACITVTVSDGSLTADTAFTLTVDAVNDKPTITAISAVTIDEDTATGAISFTVADVDNAIADLTVYAAANNTALVPRGNIAISDIAENGSASIAVTPVANNNGTATISVTVKDSSGQLNTSSFLLTVNAVNDPPTMAVISNQSTNEDTTKSINVYVSDIDTLASRLTLTATESTNTDLLPLDNEHIKITGTTGTRSVQMIPLANQNGETYVTLQVSDGGMAVAPRTFKLTVNAVNDTPSFTAGADVTVQEDCKAQTVTGWATSISAGAPNEDDTLTFNVQSDIEAMFSVQPAIDSSGNLTFTPADNANGTSVITVSLSDDGGKTSGSVEFDINITPVNDIPVAYNLTTGLDTDEDQQLKGSLSIYDPDKNTMTYELVSGTDHNVTSLITASGGTVTLDAAAGTFIYKPYKDYYAGPESFSYRVYDGTAYSNDAVVTIGLTGINDPPVAEDGTLTVNEDAEDGGGTLAGLVTDVDNVTLTYSVVSDPNNGGTVVLNAATGAYTYVPALDYFGTERFMFRAYDGATYSNSATVTITIDSVNDAPIAQSETISLDEGKTLNGTFKATDTENDAITYSIETEPASGTLTLLNAATGAYSFTPAAMTTEETVTVTAGFRAEDPSGDYTTGTVTIVIRNVNDPPYLNPEKPLAVTTAEDTAMDGSVAAIDPDGDTLTYTVLNNVNHGTLSFNTTTGSYTYTPYGNYNGTDYFTFIAKESSGDNPLSTGIYRVSITVSSVNDLPVVYDVYYYLNAGETITITPVGFDPDGNSLTYSVESTPDYGSIVNNYDGTFTYTAKTDSSGHTDLISYKATDSQGGVSEEAATIHVHIYGTTGTGGGLSYIADQEIKQNTSTEPISITVTGGITISSVSVTSSNTWLLNNDYSSDIILSKVSDSTYTVVLTPNPYRIGRTVITVRVNDTYVRTFILNVTRVYYKPTANGLTRTIDENTEMYEYVSGSDLNGIGLTFSAETSPANGNLEFASNGTFHYTPKAGFSGDDSFTFAASNGHLSSDAATVTIHVTDVPSAPTADHTSVSTPEDTVITNGKLTGTAENGVTIVYRLVSNGTLGTAVVNENGSFTYTPKENATGTDTFTFKTEGPTTLFSSIAKVTVTITPVNDKPVAVAKSVSTFEDQPLQGYLVATDVDEDDTLTYALVEADGTLTKGAINIDSATGKFTYTPNLNANGTDTFRFKANDGTEDSEPALMTITIEPQNDAPTVEDSAITVGEDSSVNGALTSLYTDVDGDAQTFTTIQEPEMGTIAFNTDGTFTYTPDENENGTDYFSYRTKDTPGLNSNVALVTVTITPENDAPTIAAADAWTIKEDSVNQVFYFTVDDIEDNPDDLTLDGTWDENAIVSDSVVFGGSGNNRWMKVTPVDSYIGSTEITIIVSDSGVDNTLTGDVKTSETTVDVTVQEVDDTPTINNEKTNWKTISTKVTIDEDRYTDPISFTVNDEEDGPSGVTVIAYAGDKTLVPDSGIVLTGAKQETRTITVTPAANQYGTTSITIRATDGNTYRYASFTLVVLPVNDPPVVTPPGDQTIPEDGNTGDLYYSISDIDSAITSITVTAASDEETLVIPTDITLTGNSADRVVKIKPLADQNGDVTITLTADDQADENNTGSASFTVHVLAVNDTPTIESIADQTIDEDGTTGAIAVNIADIDDSPSTLTLSAVSGNPSLISTDGIVFTKDSETGQNYVTLTPKADANGSALITITVTDAGGKYKSVSFTLKVNPVNDAPTITAIADQTILEDGKTPAITFHVADIDNDVLELTVTGSSDDTSVIPVSGFAFTGNGGERTVAITPTADQNGNIPSALTVRDPGGLSNSSPFVVNITPVNDEPSFTTGDDQVVLEDCELQTVSGWASNVSRGPENEKEQELTFHLENDNAALFTALGQPAVDASGNLTYTPAANMYGSASVTIYLTDNGGTDGGGDDTSDNNPSAEIYADTFTITVRSVNDQPTFSALDANEDITVDEDSGDYEEGWADLSSLFIGPENNETQTYHFYLTLGTIDFQGNTGLFSDVPAIDSQTGVITFTPAKNANGTAEVTVVLKDDDGTAYGGLDTSVDHTFTITVSSVNDDPTFTLGDPIVVNEDSGLYSATYATGITKGGGTDELGQRLTFTLDADDDSLFSVDPEMTADGLLTFATADDAYGTATVAISLDDETNTVSDSFTITLNPVNDAPTFIMGANQTVWEDCGIQTVPGWGTSLYEGADNEDGQSLWFETESHNTSLYTASGLPAIESTGKLIYTPAANANGTDYVTVTLNDDGDTLYGGIHSTTYEYAWITVLPVNDQPSFIDLDDITVSEDSGTYNKPWVQAGSISVGPTDEAGQTYAFSMTEDTDKRETYGNTSLFADEPAINPDTGDITFTPAENANGKAYYTVYLKDSGGTDREGVDTSIGHTLIITIGDVDDDPTFTLSGTVTVNEDSGDYRNDTYATNITPGGGTDESEQTLTIQLLPDDDTLFSEQPVLTTAGRLTFKTAANANGSTAVTAKLSDGTNTIEKNFTIVVQPVNDQPSFTDTGDVAVDEDCGIQTVNWVSGYSVGPVNETQTHTFTLEEVSRTTEGNTRLFSAGPAINATTGVVTFTPETNANGSVTYNVYMKDGGGTDREGVDTSIMHTLTIIVNKVNDDPTFTLGDPIVVDEDSGLYSETYVTGITRGGGTDEEDQKLTFTLSGYDNSLFTEAITLSTSGELVFNTVPDAHGSTTVNVSLSDGTNTVSDHFTITVNSINDQPSFTKGEDQTVWEDCGTKTVNGWATKLNKGAANESGQTLSFDVSNNNENLFTSDGQPKLDTSGNLTYTPAADAFGVATVSVKLQDNGGTELTGVDTSETAMFTITVESVNDQPVFDSIGNITVNEDSAAYDKPWVKAGTIDVGPSNETQTCAFSMTEDAASRETNGNTSLFTDEPAVDPDTGDITFTPAENANGKAFYTVYLMDNDGVERGGVDTSEAHELVITVESINDLPTITLGGTVTVNEDSGDYSNDTYATNITPGGGTDEAHQNLTLQLTADNEALFSEQPVLTTTGRLTFKTAANANGSATVTMTLNDETNTVEKTFTIVVQPVNDQPSFTDTGDVAVDEDCGIQTVNWVSGYSVGPVNETQTHTFTLEEVSRTTEGNTRLFSAGPAINATTGVVTFTPETNANGSVTYNVYMKDGGGTDREGVDTSAVHTFTITVNKVNDAPTFTLGDPIIVNEDSGLYAETYVTGITRGGGTDEEDQKLTFTLSGYDSSLFTEAITLSTSGELVFNTVPDAHGSTTVNVSLSDGTNTVSDHFTITINSINDQPTFVKGADQTVLEDCGTKTVNGWATKLNKGAANESGQTLSFDVTNNKNTLFTSDGQPALDVNGKLTYTPAADAFGVATVSVKLQDNGGTELTGVDTSETATFTITVESVNDQPVFEDMDDITVNEDSGTYDNPWIKAGTIDPGPSNETQTCAFSMTEKESKRITKGNTSLFSTAPAINPDTGAITFTPSENASGKAFYTVYLKDSDGVERGGMDTSEAHELVITVESINDLPTITLGGTVTVNEDSIAYRNDTYATNITPGGGTDEERQKLTIQLLPDNDALFSEQPVLTTSGRLTFTPAANANGSTTVTMTLNDETNTVEKTFTIVILPVNDQPTFTDIGDVEVGEDCGIQTVDWVSGYDVGPANETQTPVFSITQTVIADDVLLFSAEPAIDPLSGKITFTPADDAFGSAQITVVLADADGTANGGVDTSQAHTFTITVNAINDQPVFKDNGDITVDEDSGAYASVWVAADSISPGPINEAQECTFSMELDETTLTVSGNTELFKIAPAMDETTGEISFTPAENASGQITATVTLKDTDGVENGGADTSEEHTFTILVNAVNDMPVFTGGGDISVGVGTGAYEQALWATDISAGPIDETDQELSFAVNADKPELFDTLPAISADGTLTFTPSETESGSALITVSLGDDGGTDFGGIDTSAEMQFTINVVSNTELVLTGTVLSARTGDPVNGAYVRMLDQNGGEITAMTVGADGVYRFTGLSDSSDDVQVIASADGYQNNSLVTQVSFATDLSGTITRDIPLSQFNLSVTADPDVILGDGKSNAEITALVTDDTGEPIRGVAVSFYCESGNFKNGHNTTETGRDGSCSVTFVSQKLSGTTELTIPIKVVVSSEEKRLYGTTEIYVRFSPGFVEGIVKDGDNHNKPVKGAIVTVYKDFNGDGIIDFTKTVETGENGRYKVAVPRGDVEYNINITKPVTINGTETQVTFEQMVQVNTITGSGGETTNPSKSAIGIITLQTEEGSAAGCGELLDAGIYMEIVGNGIQQEVNLDPDTGVFSADNLAEGTYTLNVYYEYEDGTRIIVSSREITITSSGETNISEVLIDPYGIVTDRNTGAAIEGATVQLYYADTAGNIANGRTPYSLVSLPSVSGFPPSNNSNPQQTDSAGLYAFMVYSDTDYYIVATKAGYETYTSGTISVGSSIVHFNFAMTPEEKQDDDRSSTSGYYDPAVYVSTDRNRVLENGFVVCTVTYGNKTNKTLSSAAIQLLIPQGITVEDADGGTLHSYYEKAWRSTKKLRLLPEWVESDYEHKIIWGVKNLKPDMVYTKTVILRTAFIGEAEPKTEKTLKAVITTKKRVEVEEDDLSLKTFVVASRTNPSTHEAYFTGQTDPAFRASDILTRADAAAVFAAILGLSTEETQTSFTDVSPDDPYAGAVKAITDTGYMRGLGHNKFYPDQGVSRAQFITMVARYLGIERPYYIEPLSYHFTDIECNSARSSIEEAYRYGLVLPYEDGSFRPYQVVTRGEAVRMLNRMLCLGSITNAASPYTDVLTTDPGFGEIAAAVMNTETLTNEDGTETIVD